MGRLAAGATYRSMRPITTAALHPFIHNTTHGSRFRTNPLRARDKSQRPFEKPHLFSLIPQRHHTYTRLQLKAAQAETAESSSASLSSSPELSPLNQATTTTNPAATPSSRPPAPKVDLRGLPILRLQPDIVAAGGLDPSTQPPQLLTQFDQTLREDYLAVNLTYPGLRILNIVPPVLTVPAFLTEEECNKLVQGAGESGLMKTSGVSEHVGQMGACLRTSSTVAITSGVLREQPLLSEGFQSLLAKAAELLPDVGALVGESGGESKDVFKVPNKPKQVALELPQVTRYERGQYFLHHYDAFPTDVARGKGYQRRATLLLYLNDVSEGGGTNFHSLEMCVRPKKGTALLFFPSFSNGVSDPRTLHTAEEAVDTKWVSQTWISCGLEPSQGRPSPVGQGQGSGNQPKFAVPLPNPFKTKSGAKKKSRRK